MTDLFRTLDDLKPFIFRITDNGGETADRYTVITCDGDYFGMSGSPFHPQGFGQSGEGIDVQGVADRVEAGVERDLRWIDLPTDCQRCVMGGLNQGFADYIKSEPAAASRDEARDWQGQWNEYGDDRTPIYREGESFYIRDDERDFEGDGGPNAGPFATFAEAVRYMLPQDYDLSGPEYHAGVDMWNEEGGPVTPWDRDSEPPMIDSGHEMARVTLTGPDGAIVGHFATGEDASHYVEKLEEEYWEKEKSGDFPTENYVIDNPDGW